MGKVLILNNPKSKRPIVYWNAKIFLEEMGNPYNIILLDDEGTISIEWGAYGVPETFLIYNKKVIKKIIGPIDEKVLLEIKELI